MNSIHDLGGMHGMGPIDIAPDQPLFPNEWERRMFGVCQSVGLCGYYNVDEFRHSIERMDPAAYLATPYYEHWAFAIETLLTEKGVLAPGEVAAREGEITRENGT